MKKSFIIFASLVFTIMAISAHNTTYNKMSSFVRLAAKLRKTSVRHSPSRNVRSAYITAFVRTTGDGRKLLEDNGCVILEKLGNIYIVSIPLENIETLAFYNDVERIEARRSCTLLMDTTSFIVNALPVYAGENLPQAYTGKGVVMGVQDVGFDLTHPNFYNTTLSDYRIKRFWDQLSTDADNKMYVGAEYTTEEAIKAYAHSRDGLVENHGTHTLGIAAGSGYDSHYRGMAYESDICLVSNAVTSDTIFIDDNDLYKYTSATDVLGFKYIFDYADEVGKPCVISFSEGSHQDFSGDDVLMYEALQELIGPGRIIIASAGNEGHIKTYFRKPAGTESTGTFLRSDGNYAYLKMQADRPFDIRMTVYGNSGSEQFVLSTSDVLECDAAEFIKDVMLTGESYNIDVTGYPSCYAAGKTAYEIIINCSGRFGIDKPFSIEVIGSDADVEVYRGTADFVNNSRNLILSAGEYTHSIYSPGSAPDIICAGATAHRSAIKNYLGEMVGIDWGNDGRIAGYSSVGPTFDGRIKPDVVAPGTNVISSFSSFYMENAGTFSSWDAAHFVFDGRTYAWINNIGTSMSTPVVGGAVALWLQANPNLTPDDIRGVLSRTCHRYDESMSYPNNYYGYGEIDVYRGLLDILGLTNIDEISYNQPEKAQIMLSNDGILSVSFPICPSVPFTLSVYTAGGVRVISREFMPTSSYTYTVDMSSLPRGVYVVQLSANATGFSGSTLLRR